MDKYIVCTTKKQWEDVLKKFEEDGYKWLAGNSVLSGLGYFSDYKRESVLHVHTDIKRLGYGERRYYSDKTFIYAHDFLKGAKTKPIVISRNGRVVTAEDKNTGEKGVATCSPSDEFDFKIGAKIALARLWGEEVPKSLGFKVGDLVTLKEGLKINESYGRIRLLNDMYDMGYHKAMRVIEVDDSCMGLGDVYKCVSGYSESVYYWFSEEMLEKYEDDDEIRENDIVEVVEPLQCYDTYTAWIIKNIASVALAAKFVYHRTPKTDAQYRVIKIASHSGDSKLKLAYIQDQIREDCFIMNLSALKKVKK